MSEHFYRFKRTQMESLSALKGANSWYAITGAHDEPRFACHVIGSCLGGTSTFHASREDAAVLFRLEPKRKFLNLTYYVSEGESGPRIATIELFAGRGMKVRGPGGREQYRVVDPQSKLDKFMQTVLEGACSEYALVADDRVIGQFGRRDRNEEPTTERKGLLGWVMKGLAKALLRDWCVELEDEGKVIDDHRPLLAGMILMLEQTIAHDQAT
ncbi:MAG: hypothetical protein QNK04_02250 [Myxococcota bacterium]|nr:hypothetical protein [Myxococcota bacterium]